MLPNRDCFPCSPHNPGALNGVPPTMQFRLSDQWKINALTSNRSDEGRSERDLQRVLQRAVLVTCSGS